jgi:acyl-CoA synthetase (AMP-forming)/AMP-acid ligase II
MANIATHLKRMAEQFPTRPAIIAFCPGRNGANPEFTFRELHEASDHLAHGFQQIGIGRGMRTALMVPPGFDFFALTFALFKLEAVPVLIDPGMGLRNLGKSLDEAAPQAFIGSLKAHAASLLLGWCRKSVSIRVTASAPPLAGGYSLKQVAALGAGRGPFPLTDPAPDEIAAILFTSGSTGPAKGVVYTHDYFGLQIEHIKRLYGIEPGEIDLATFPLFALFSVALGMTVIVPDMDPTRPAQVDPSRLIAAIEQFGITSMFGSPAVINRLGRYGEARRIRLSSLRRVIVAGAPVSPKVLQRFTVLLPATAQVFTPYGATECLPVSSIGSDEILSETRYQTDIGRGVCVGLPVPGLTVKIIKISDEAIQNWDDSLELPPIEIGEIAVKGPHVTRSYYHRPEATASAKILDTRNGGFYHRMGDIGYRDERGRIWFCGRKSQRVITSHGTLFTIPCEAVFNTHPAISRSALVGVQRGDRTEPVLCLEREPSASISDENLRAELAALAAKHPHTKAISTFLFHSGFPVDVRHNAKIFREKLSVWATDQLRNSRSPTEARIDA